LPDSLALPQAASETAMAPAATAKAARRIRVFTSRPNSVSTVARAFARDPADDDHSSSPVIADRIKRPTRERRTGRSRPRAEARRCSPIWSCSVRGFACHPCYHGRGALLPHLFTLTRLRPCGLRRSGMFSVPLSFRLPRPGVTRRTALWSSDFPPSAFAPPFGVGETTIIPLAPSSLTGSSSLPGSIGRAVLERFPIWPCSVRGFACHPCCHGRGALLPHLFTIACRLAPASAVCFLCHFPSSCPDRALPGALPCGVRTFLPPSPLRGYGGQARHPQ
jgi:hypothetical protein